MVRAFIQARMSSSRLPGKVLAPFNGKPIVLHVIERIAQVIPPENIIILTSTESSDDPLAVYLEYLGVNTFRGSLADVFGRFRLCLSQNPCDWFIRISADSPLIDSSILAKMLPHQQNRELDLVTNIMPRTFPKGHSAEMIKSETFQQLDPAQLTDDDKEHVTKYYYRHQEQFKILNIESENPVPEGTSLAVDTLEDFRRLEKIARQQAE